MLEQFHHLDKSKVKQAFNAAADSYDEVAELQRQVGRQIVERLQIIKTPFTRIMDIGSGTGYCHELIRKDYPNAEYISLDLAFAMLTKAKSKHAWFKRWFRRPSLYVCGDTESLPVADNSVDLIFSNLTLQWVNDFASTCQELYRILRPGGLLMFSTLGPDTLKELRQSWLLADQNTHVHSFIDMHNVGDMLLHAQFSDPVMDIDYYTLQYAKVETLMRELKALGAHNAHSQQSHGLTGKTRLVRMKRAYEQYRQQGKLPATYEVVFGHAWKSSDPANQVNVCLS